MSGAYVVRGHVGPPHGVKGLLRVFPETDFPERLAEVDAWTLRDAQGRLSTVEIERIQPHKDGWLVKFRGIDDRTAAEAFRSLAIVQLPAELPELDEDEYYWHQLLGLEVVTLSGRRLGPVTEIIRTGSNDVYVTAGGLIPAIREVVKEVDLEAGEIRIEPLPGLLDA